MSFTKRFVVTPVTAADGTATAYTPRFTGRISQIRYVKPGVAADFAAGVDFTITVEGTGEGIWTEANVNASKTVAPRQPTHGIVGDAALYAAGGAAVNDKIAVYQDRVKIAIAQGGDTKTGTFHITVDADWAGN